MTAITPSILGFLTETRGHGGEPFMPNAGSLSVPPCLCEKKTATNKIIARRLVVFLTMIGLSLSSRSAASHVESGAV